MHVWSYGLAEFLRHSNEDAVSCDFISRIIARYTRLLWPECGSFVRMADIGCGPGSKAVRIGNSLHARAIKSHWDLIDVDHRWKDALASNVHESVVTNHVRFDLYCPLSAHDWIRAIPTPPHVAQFIHVPYDDETEEIVFDISMKLLAQKCIIFISTEHPKSDLHVIREKLRSLGLSNLPSGRVRSLGTRFSRRGLVVHKHYLGRQFLDIGTTPGQQPPAWFWDLIFGDCHGTSDSAFLSENVDGFVKRGFIPSLGTSLLSVPDLLISVRQRQ